MTARGVAESGLEAVDLPGQPAAALAGPSMFRRRSGQPSRRAVLHVQAAGDPAVPPDLGAWYTERGFHFYVAWLRLPDLAPVGARPAARYLSAAFADLDAACAHLRDADGMASVIVSAQGRGAIAAALWRDARAAAADALILLAPRLPAGASLSLEIDCPVLVLSGPAGAGGGPQAPAASRGWPVRRRRPAPADDAALSLGGHVTWLRLPAGPAAGERSDPGLLFDALGRWLGAYMYGPVRDQLL